jgi:hypothetical protein
MITLMLTVYPLLFAPVFPLAQLPALERCTLQEADHAELVRLFVVIKLI